MEQHTRIVASALVSLATLVGGVLAGPLVLVSSRGDNMLTALEAEVLEAEALEVEWTLDAELGMHEIAFSPDGTLAIGSAYGSGHMHEKEDNRLAVIDVVQRRVKHVIGLGEHVRPNDIAFVSDDRALVTAEKTGFLLEVDALKGEVVREIELGKPAGHMLAVHAESGRAYVSHVMPGSVSVVDIERGEVIGSIDTGPGCEGIAVSPDGRFMWAANHGAQTISVIDARALRVVDTLACPGFPFRVRFTPDGEKVVVSNPSVAAIELFDAETREHGGRIGLFTVGPNPMPTSIALTDDSEQLLVVCAGAEVVALVDMDKGRVVRTLRVGPTPDGLGVTG